MKRATVVNAVLGQVILTFIVSVLFYSNITQAANADSDIVGKVLLQTTGSDYRVKAQNKKTGATRETSVDSEGKFRLTRLPIGDYLVVLSENGRDIKEQSVRVSLGRNATANFDAGSQAFVEEVFVTGTAAVDTLTVDSGLVIGEAEIDSMPITRSLNAVALLAPGVIRGDSGFGSDGLASFGGASVAENACIINGLEVTNTRQGLGCSSVPFEMFKEFQVKTGGYSAEFGRTTGGLINAVTKSGGNEWEFMASVDYSPDALRADQPISRGDGSTGTVFRNNSKNESEEADIAFSVAGPIVQDKLFAYVLINPRKDESAFANDIGRDRYTGDNEFRRRNSSGSDNLFWGAKIDWEVNDEHRLSYFGFSDRTDTEEETFEFDAETSVIGDKTGEFERLRGSIAHSFSYTGILTDDLAISALWGTIETEYTTNPLDNLDCPTVSDNRDPSVISGCGPGGTLEEDFDENTQYRFDIEYFIGNHQIKAGIDVQERESTNSTEPVAGHSYAYETLASGGSIQGNQGPIFTNNSGEPVDYVRDRIFAGGGGFNSELTAYYIEDKWQVTDTLLVSIGLRKDIYEGEGTTGKQLFEFDTDIAPRLGFTWHVNQGNSKFYGTYGRYYLPVANNTIFRAASGVSDVTTFYSFTGVDADTGIPTGITPISGSLATSQNVNSVSTIPEKDIFQAREADPFSRDEIILGYETNLNDELSLNVRGVYRSVTSALDDYCGSYAFPYCVLLNPGETSTWAHDGYYYDGTDLTIIDELFDGTPDPDSFETYSADTIGLPKAKNEYRAVQTEVKYQQETITMNFIYTLSKSYGNFEGAVKSDIDQADAGITQDFDFPALQDGSDGYQPNDRRHVFKLFGSYKFTDSFSVGLNATLQSGRPLSAFGRGYPSNDPNLFGSYGDTFYILNDDGSYTRRIRGSAGRTPWQFNVDLSSRYNFTLNGVEFVASLDIFNVLDIQEASSLNEHYEITEGNVNQFYGAAYDWQQPRSARFGLLARF